jgi:hypothetical protein
MSCNFIALSVPEALTSMKTGSGPTREGGFGFTHSSWASLQWWYRLVVETTPTNHSPIRPFIRCSPPWSEIIF